jgi:hypothetical protein
VYGAGELKYFDATCARLAKRIGLPYPHCMMTLTSEELQKLAEGYLGHLRGFSDSALRVTDKMPSNFVHVGLLSVLFPNARVIHCRRNPLDTCLSIFFQKFSGHPYSRDLGDLGHYYREYARLMEHWRTVLPPGLMLEVQYEELVDSPDEISRKLIEFCGLAWNDSCLKSHENERVVRTASSWQVRQPIYKTSKERWKRYEKHLGPLREALSGKQANA